MKKIAMTLLLGYSISFSSDCVKMQIDELKYMKKNELIEAYKYQDSQLQLNRKYSDEDMAKSKEYESKGELGMAIYYNKQAIKSSTGNSCHEGNKDNIKRVLEKDFKVTENELNKLINLGKTK